VIARPAVLLALLAACGSGGGFPDAPSIPDAAAPGSFRLDWSIVDAQSKPKTCANANATSVIVSLHEETTGGALSASFHCDAGSGISGAVPIGTYDLGFTLVGIGTNVATATAQNGVIVQSNKTTQLAPVVFKLP
jgi:hypothetical protein